MSAVDKRMRCLVTGGAGFIGSNLVDALVARGDEVRVLDDLSTGHRDNVNAKAELIEAEVSDEAAVRAAVDGCELVFHQAAHRAVLRSVEDPLATDTANVHGTLTVLEPPRNAGVRRVVYASSSSVYGGRGLRPTPETAPLIPRSPYAVTKLTGEHYCRVFTELHGLETVALRYFNVFGPRQRPDSMYAAVIPLFIDALRTGQRPNRARRRQAEPRLHLHRRRGRRQPRGRRRAGRRCSGHAYNIACGGEYSLLDLLEHLGEILGVPIEPEHTEPTGRRAPLVRRCVRGRARSELEGKLMVEMKACDVGPRLSQQLLDPALGSTKARVCASTLVATLATSARVVANSLAKSRFFLSLLAADSAPSLRSVLMSANKSCTAWVCASTLVATLATESAPSLRNVLMSANKSCTAWVCASTFVATLATESAPSLRNVLMSANKSCTAWVCASTLVATLATSARVVANSLAKSRFFLSLLGGFGAVTARNLPDVRQQVLHGAGLRLDLAWRR